MDPELPEPDVIFDGVPYLHSLERALPPHDEPNALAVRAPNYEPGTFANALSIAARRDDYVQTERVLADATRGGFEARSGRLDTMEALLGWALTIPRPRLLRGPLPAAMGRTLVLAAGRGDLGVVHTLLSLRLRSLISCLQSV